MVGKYFGWVPNGLRKKPCDRETFHFGACLGKLSRMRHNIRLISQKGRIQNYKRAYPRYASNVRNEKLSIPLIRNRIHQIINSARKSAPVEIVERVKVPKARTKRIIDAPVEALRRSIRVKDVPWKLK